jgi:hypothetical protein
VGLSEDREIAVRLVEAGAFDAEVRGFYGVRRTATELFRAIERGTSNVLGRAVDLRAVSNDVKLADAVRERWRSM